MTSPYDEDNMPAFFSKKKKANRQEKSQKSEKRLAKSLGMRTTPGSGNKHLHPSDIVGKYFRIEHKRTDKKSISLKKEWLDTIAEQAFSRKQNPVLAIQFGEDAEVFLIKKEMFERLLLLMGEFD